MWYEMLVDGMNFGHVYEEADNASLGCRRKSSELWGLFPHFILYQRV